jgi:hypothetical protein
MASKYTDKGRALAQEMVKDKDYTPPVDSATLIDVINSRAMLTKPLRKIKDKMDGGLVGSIQKHIIERNRGY